MSAGPRAKHIDQSLKSLTKSGRSEETWWQKPFLILVPLVAPSKEHFRSPKAMNSTKSPPAQLWEVRPSAMVEKIMPGPQKWPCVRPVRCQGRNSRRTPAKLIEAHFSKPLQVVRIPNRPVPKASRLGHDPRAIASLVMLEMLLSKKSMVALTVLLMLSEGHQVCGRNPPLRRWQRLGNCPDETRRRKVLRLFCGDSASASRMFS